MLSLKKIIVSYISMVKIANPSTQDTPVSLLRILFLTSLHFVTH